MRIAVIFIVMPLCLAHAYGEERPPFPSCYTDEQLEAADIAARTLGRYGTLYSGGNFFSHRDNVSLSLQFFRLLNGKTPDLANAEAGTRIWDRDHDVSPDGNEQHLRTALELALIEDPDTYDAVLEASGFDLIPPIDLDLYTSPRLPADWWLNEPRQLMGKREKVTAKVARDNELLDWLQTASVSSATPWAVHSVFAPDETHENYKHPEYAQLIPVANHAYDRWKRGDGPEWAAVAFEILPPPPYSQWWDRDDKARELRLFYYQLFNRAKSCKASSSELATFMGMSLTIARRSLIDFSKTAEVTATLDRSNALRPYIDEYVSMAEILQKAELPPRQKRHNAFRQQQITAFETIRDALDIDNGTEFAAFFLTDDLDEIISILNGPRPHSAGAHEMLDLVAYRHLRTLAETDALSEAWRADLGRAAFIRSYMLGDLQSAYDMLPLLADLHPVYADEIHHIAKARQAREKQRRLTMFLLRHPGFNHTVGARSFRYHRYPRDLGDLRKIDTFQHSAANWWCAGDTYIEYIQRIKTNALGALMNDRKELPSRYHAKRTAQLRRIHARRTGFRHRWSAPMDEVINRHPLMKLVDLEEVDRLSNTISGPELLTTSVIEWVDEDSFKRRLGLGDPRIPEALHLAVVTTRYGCQRQGGHGRYSHEAYRLLHRHYGETAWASETPYWFDDKHFSPKFRPISSEN